MLASLLASLLAPQEPASLQHMILVHIDEGRTESDQRVNRSFYIFPEHLPGSVVSDVGVVGGIFIEGGTPETPNPREFDLVIEGAKRFYGM